VLALPNQEETMTQGLFVGTRMERPKSKKAVKEAVAAGTPLYAEATSFHGNEYDGSVYDAPVGSTIVFVGPDPSRDRRFYGTIKVTANGVKVT
jgi:hypothetical protein